MTALKPNPNLGDNIRLHTKAKGNNNVNSQREVLRTKAIRLLRNQFAFIEKSRNFRFGSQSWLKEKTEEST